jgi:hypothetical protein
MNLWKVLGLAGVAGVAAAGVIIAREQRQRTQLAPEEIRARLHERLEQAPEATTRGTAQDAAISSSKRPRWLQRPHRRRRTADGQTANKAAGLRSS